MKPSATGRRALRARARIRKLLAEQGGSDAAQLGITLDSLRQESVYQWLLAALLFGAPISHTVAARTWLEFARSDALTPQRIIGIGWKGLVDRLARSGYTRYDYKTATKLLEVSERLAARLWRRPQRPACGGARCG